MKECDASVEQAGQESRRRQRGGAGIQKVRRRGEREDEILISVAFSETCDVM